MSVDLFAAFNDPPSASEQAQDKKGGYGSVSGPTQNDPFTFLASPSQQLSGAQACQSSSTVTQIGSRGAGPSWQGKQQSQNVSNIWGNVPDGGLPQTRTSVSQITEKVEDDDAWGDFEVAPSQPSQPSKSVPAALALPAPAVAVAKSELSPRARILRVSTLDLMTNKLLHLGSTAPDIEPWPERSSVDQASRQSTKQSRPRESDPNVLFDADDYDGQDERDDFGEFESVETGLPAATTVLPQPVQKPPPASADLLGLDDWSTPTMKSKPSSSRKEPPGQLFSTSSSRFGDGMYPQAPKSPSFHERNPFPGLGLTTPKSGTFPEEAKTKAPSPITAWPGAADPGANSAAPDDDDWGDFDLQTPADTRVPGPQIEDSKQDARVTGPERSVAIWNAETDWHWDARESTKPDTLSKLPNPTDTTMPCEPRTFEDVSGPPPTNVPPPSVVLSLFPELLNTARTVLIAPLAGQPAAVREYVLSDPKTAAFLRSYLALVTVAARVVAGRKLRWHRDRFLAQGMAIAAAVPGGGRGGMKLAGVDRSQTARENREATDVIAVWRDLVGPLRGVVAAVAAAEGTAAHQPLRLPELVEYPAVQTVKMVPPAPKACFLCGLKRDERVARVDFEVEDSFGEWWIEHWGHRACRNLWLEHEVKLRQR